MPTYDGNLLTLDVELEVFGIIIKVTGTVEILNVRKRTGPR